MQQIQKLIRKILRLVYRPARRVLSFFRWSIPGIFNLLKPRCLNASRVLVIYDTASQPFSVGDFLLFLEASLVLCHKHNVNIVDIALVYDSKNPASSSPVFAGIVTDDTLMFHLASILPLAQVNQFLGSVFVFNCQEQLQQHIIDNIDRYYVWPTGWQVSIREYLSPQVFNDLLYKHFKEHGEIPHLACRPFLKDWAFSFYQQHANGYVPVTINIRNNKGWQQHRNSQLDAWLAFFKYCEARYPAKFIILCAHSEIDNRWFDCSNVIIAKDYQTGVEQDMALIHTSAIHMGTGSGPTATALFSSKPYLIVNMVLEVGGFYYYSDMFEQLGQNIQRFWFASPMQHVANGVETSELLISEFALMWEAIDLQKWQNKTHGDDVLNTKINSWLR